MIAALEKAQSLRRFATASGAQLCTFLLVLTDPEALELLDWLIETNADNELLRLDVEQAKRSGDPWPVIQNFNMLGIEMAPVKELH